MASLWQIYSCSFEPLIAATQTKASIFDFLVHFLQGQMNSDYLIKVMMIGSWL